MKRIAVICLSLMFVAGYSQAQGVAGGLRDAGVSRVSEYKKVFTTYPFSDPSPVPLMNNVYPYFRYDGFTTKPEQRKWTVVELENGYLRLLILPEIGGKVWAAIEKSTGKSFLYYNHVVKFRDIAMRGPWTSGGLEANYGIIGHTPNCATPVDYQTRTNSDGSVSCFIGTLDLLTRSYWRVEINLPADKAYFTTRSFWYNTTPLDQPYYHWMNAGLKAGGGLEFIYPGNKYLGHNGEYGAWPVDSSNGKKISFYDENDFGTYKSYHVFGKYTDFAGAYWHADSLGMVRYGTHDDKAGKKIWIWGLSRQGMIWEKLLTDSDGQYVELQSGRLFNQNTEKSSLTPFKHLSLAPYQTDNWKEYWYPVLGTRGIVAASEIGAMNIVVSREKLVVRLSPVQAIDDTLWIRDGEKLIYQRRVKAGPLRVFADSLTFSGGVDGLRVVLGQQLLSWSGAATAGDLARPVDAPAGFDWGSAYGQYLMACEDVDQKDYRGAERALDSALRRDAWFLPALVKKAELCYRNLRFGESLELAKKALSVNTEDGEANYYYGLANMQLGRDVDARDGFDIASLSPAWRSPAYTSLARLYLKEKNFLRAAACVEKALVAQPQNMDAMQLGAVIGRLRGDSVGYRGRLGQLSALDPLNTFALFEEKGAGFAGMVRNELPQETFLELGCWYAGCGQEAEAIRVLRLSPQVAEVKIWLAWLEHRAVDTAELDPVRAFPFRGETGVLLEKMVAGQPGMVPEKMVAGQPGWFLKYQLALIYNDRGRVAEALRLVAGLEPGYAPFYAFRAALDSSGALRDLEKAVAVDGSWRYVKLLAEYCLAHGDVERALALAGVFYSAHPDNYIMGLLNARALLALGHYAECVALLRRLEIIPFEGATAGRELYREALLMEAVGAIRRGDYRRGLGFVSDARKWPENLGVGAPYMADQDLYVEDELEWRCLMGLRRSRDAAVVKQRLAGRQVGKSAADKRVLAALGE